MIELEAIDSTYTGVSFEKEGTVVVVEGFLTNKRLFRKSKTSRVYIVKITKVVFELCAGCVDASTLWRNVAWYDYDDYNIAKRHADNLSTPYIVDFEENEE